MSTSLRELPIDERIRLVEDLWDSIAEDQEALSVPESHKHELDARLRTYELDGDLGEDAHAVIERIRKAL
jgi:putative addiction module component (TIGR02574 family)